MLTHSLTSVAYNGLRGAIMAGPFRDGKDKGRYKVRLALLDGSSKVCALKLSNLHAHAHNGILSEMPHVRQKIADYAGESSLDEATSTRTESPRCHA